MNDTTPSTQPTERPPEWPMMAAQEIDEYRTGISPSPNKELCRTAAAIIAKHAPRETANARLVRAASKIAKDAAEYVERGGKLTPSEESDVKELNAALSATEAQPATADEIGSALEFLMHERDSLRAKLQTAQEALRELRDAIPDIDWNFVIGDDGSTARRIEAASRKAFAALPKLTEPKEQSEA